MDIPRLYKVSGLPTSPTPADDGIYFVRPNPSVGYVCYIITNGVAVQQDAVTTNALTALLGDYVKKDGSVAMENYLPFDGNDSVNKGVVWRTSGRLRFVLMTDPNQESSGNTGSNLTLYRYADNGSFIGNVFRINRATGVVTFQDNIATVSQYTSAEWALGFQAYQMMPNKANINGSNTTGGSWVIDYILSPVLQAAVGNSQVLFSKSDGTIDYGSSFVISHRFQCSNIHGLKIGVDNVGNGEVWHEFNFDPEKGYTAYNERVTQFNTTYTTSVYTFSILLANGVQKQTTLQVSSAHFVIGGTGGAGVLYLSDAISQKISDSQTALQVQSAIDNSIAPIIEGVDFINVPNIIPKTVTIAKKKTIINVSNAVIGFDIEVTDGLYDGYSLAINGGAEWSGILRGSFRISDGSSGNVNHSGDTSGSLLFWWVASMGQWVQV